MRLTAATLLPAIALVSLATTLSVLPPATWATTATLSLAAGVAALAMMAMAALLGSRWRWLEDVFGGLDRVYEVHKWLGVWALVLACVHFLFPAEDRGWQVAAILELPRPWTRLLRQLAFLALGLIVLLALNRRIPYAAWRWWHKLSGPLFAIVVLHWLSFRSPIALVSAPGLWLAACSALGLAGAAWKLLGWRFFSRHAEYRITAVTPGAASVRLAMQPVGRGLAFEAGQFAFLRLLQPGLREPHPFTIASADRGAHGEVQFVIRALGDYTERLVAEAAPGMHAEVHAPFGRFQRGQADLFEVWIAGGVGLSPFVAWLQDPAREDFAKVTLFNFHTPGREFPGMDALAADARRRGVDWVAVPDGPDSAVFADRFGWLVGQVGADRIRVSFCGPAGLLARVRAEMARLGIPGSRLQYERFEFR